MWTCLLWGTTKMVQVNEGHEGFNFDCGGNGGTLTC